MGSSDLSGAVSDLVDRVADAADWKWFITGTYRKERREAHTVLDDFRSWLRNCTLLSANFESPDLAYRVARSSSLVNRTPTDAGHRLALSEPGWDFRGKATRKFKQGKWRASYCVSVEPHQRAGLHWHAVLSDPIGAPFTLNWDVLRQEWLDRFGRVDVQAVRTAPDAVGYVSKSLAYTMKQGCELEFSPDVVERLQALPCPI